MLLLDWSWRVELNLIINWNEECWWWLMSVDDRRLEEFWADPNASDFCFWQSELWFQQNSLRFGNLNPSSVQEFEEIILLVRCLVGWNTRVLSRCHHISRRSLPLRSRWNSPASFYDISLLLYSINAARMRTPRFALAFAIFAESTFQASPAAFASSNHRSILLLVRRRQSDP